MARLRAPKKVSKAPIADADGAIRLQRILAAAGLGSRRACEELILSGRVEVDRQVVTELGTKADPAEQEIRVDGVALPKTRLVYFVVHKPPGVLCTSRDPAGRMRAIDLVPYEGRLFAVGRLDKSSEGLLLVTNDGPLADQLTHPRYGVAKTYRVEVAGTLDHDQLAQLRKGVHLAEGPARAEAVRVLRKYKQSTLLEIVLTEGRNREIRRMLARMGHKVVRLTRVGIGPLRLGDLPAGAARPLTHDELRQLKHGAGKARAPKRKKAPRKTPSKRATAAPKRKAQAEERRGGGKRRRSGQR